MKVIPLFIHYSYISLMKRCDVLRFHAHFIKSTASKTYTIRSAIHGDNAAMTALARRRRHFLQIIDWAYPWPNKLKLILPDWVEAEISALGRECATLPPSAREAVSATTSTSIHDIALVATSH